MRSIGVLLVNLGTPDSPHPKDVHRYLIEFLSDPRVIDSPWLWRQLLVRGLIVPSRYRQSAESYQKIWTEEGSPLLVFGQKVQRALQKKMGDCFHIELAMRYQKPSIKKGIDALMQKQISELLIFPLFPQYASATTGSIHQEVMKVLKDFQVFPKVTFVNQYATHPTFINAFCHVGRQYPLDSYDKILFSFHGLPQRQLKKADRRNWCLKKENCCQTLCSLNQDCYGAQCRATAQLIAKGLSLPEEKYQICFQSRLGREPWLQPYASEVIKDLAKKGHKNLLVFSPSFICDCLETIYEIGIEYQAEFRHAGGEKLDLVRGLNTEPMWIDALETMINEETSSGQKVLA